jgi:hypothetical protein
MVAALRALAALAACAAALTADVKIDASGGVGDLAPSGADLLPLSPAAPDVAKRNPSWLWD